MNKKILIASFFATIMLLVPFSSVIGTQNSSLKIEKETVSFTIEPCGLNSEKQTVELTKEEAEIIKQLFNSIRERLNETETREEAEEVFKEAVVELDKYGLIGDLSIEKAQRLVTGEIGFNLHEKLKSNKYCDLVFDKLKNFNSKQGNDENRNCLIVGRTTETFFH